MRRLLLVAAVLLAVTAPAIADTPQISIALKDHPFVPAEVAVPAGVKVKLVIKNQQPVVAEFVNNSPRREKIVKPGGQIEVCVGPLDPGSYEFVDDFHNSIRGHLVAK